MTPRDVRSGCQMGASLGWSNRMFRGCPGWRGSVLGNKDQCLPAGNFSNIFISSNINLKRLIKKVQKKLSLSLPLSLCLSVSISLSISLYLYLSICNISSISRFNWISHLLNNWISNLTRIYFTLHFKRFIIFISELYFNV